MDERQAFEGYFDNQHRRKFPRVGTTGTQEREAYSAFAAGAAYARMTDQPDDRPAAGIVYIPEPKREPIRPSVPASQYPPGTRWMSEDDSVWEIDWDNQDKRYAWVQVRDHADGGL